MAFKACEVPECWSWSSGLQRHLLNLFSVGLLVLQGAVAQGRETTRPWENHERAVPDDGQVR